MSTIHTRFNAPALQVFVYFIQPLERRKHFPGTVGRYLLSVLALVHPYPTLPYPTMDALSTTCLPAQRALGLGPVYEYIVLKPVWPQCSGTQVPAVWQVQACETCLHACARPSRSC